LLKGIVALFGIAQGRWAGVWSFAPPNVSHGQSIAPLNAPLDANLRWTALFGRASPGVVDSNAAQTGAVFEDVCANAIFVWESGSGVSPNAAEDSLRIAEPITKRVQVMDGHDSKRHPAKVLLPGHPMRNS